MIHYRRQLCNHKNIVSWQLSILKNLFLGNSRTINGNPPPKLAQRRNNKVRSKTSSAAHLFVLALWRRFGACGAVLLLNVANVVMLPLPMLPIINLSRRPYWKLEIETANTSSLATFYNAPTLRLPKSYYLKNRTLFGKFSDRTHRQTKVAATAVAMGETARIKIGSPCTIQTVQSRNRRPKTAT